jgi:hypothetical protein
VKEKTYPQNTLPLRGRPKKIPRKLRNHLQAIAHEVTWLNHYHEVFLQFVDIVDGSNAGGQSSEFWDFSRWAFFGELVHRVDRITEDQWKQKKRKVNSLGAFLDDILPYVHLFSRGNYVGSTPNTFEQFRRTHPRKTDPYIPRDEFHRLNHEMDRLIGGKNFCLTEKQVNADKRALKKITLKITRYRNKHLAHMAVHKGKLPPPNLKELNDAIKHIGKLTRKYFLIGLVGSHGLAFGNEDITKIFLSPWIASEQDRQALKKKFKERQKQS